MVCIRDISAYRITGETTAQAPKPQHYPIQATSWHRNTQGKIELVTGQFLTQIQQPLTCTDAFK